MVFIYCYILASCHGHKTVAVVVWYWVKKDPEAHVHGPCHNTPSSQTYFVFNKEY